MKRIILIALSLMLVFTFAGCNTPTTTLGIDTDKPWGKSSVNYERCEYAISYMKLASENNANDREIATGTLVYELHSGISYVDLTMTAEYTYLEDDAYIDAQAGLTDTIVSTSRFSSERLSSVSSKKTVTLAARKNNDGKYVDTNSYEIEADYSNKTATAKKGQSVDPETGVASNDYKTVVSDINLLSDSDIFDNEQMYYTIRALKALEAEGSETIQISNIYEISSSLDSKGRYSSTSMAVSVSSSLKVHKLNKDIFEDYLSTKDDLTPDENGDFPINCMVVSVGKGTPPTGPSTILHITDKNIIFEHSVLNTKTGKIIIEMHQSIYNLTTRERAYSIDYTLTDYTTVESN